MVEIVDASKQAALERQICVAIDPATHDIGTTADGSDIAVARGASAVAMHVRQRLQTYQGEWFLDTSAGLAWLQELLGKQYNPALAEAVVKAKIMETEGVAEVLSFSVSFDGSTRGLIIKEIVVRVDSGEEVAI